MGLRCGFLTATFVGIGGLLKTSAAAAPGGGLVLKKSTPPAIDLQKTFPLGGDSILISVLSANLLFASRGKTGLAQCMDPPCVARENVRLRTPQAMRAILLASAIASLNRLSHPAAASIQDLRPCFELPKVGDAPRHRPMTRVTTRNVRFKPLAS
jgi:hypothetical protein